MGHSEQMLGGVELMDNVIQDSSFGVTFKGKVTNSEISGNEISGAQAQRGVFERFQGK